MTNLDPTDSCYLFIVEKLQMSVKVEMLSNELLCDLTQFYNCEHFVNFVFFCLLLPHTATLLNYLEVNPRHYSISYLSSPVVVAGPAALASPENVYKMQILRLHTQHYSEALGRGRLASNPRFSKPSR